MMTSATLAGERPAVLHSANGTAIAGRMVALSWLRMYGERHKLAWSIFIGPITGTRWLEISGPEDSISAFMMQALIPGQVVRSVGLAAPSPRPMEASSSLPDLPLFQRTKST